MKSGINTIIFLHKVYGVHLTVPHFPGPNRETYSFFVIKDKSVHSFVSKGMKAYVFKRPKNVLKVVLLR